jgi:hypothetical protein
LFLSNYLAGLPKNAARALACYLAFACCRILFSLNSQAKARGTRRLNNYVFNIKTRQKFHRILSGFLIVVCEDTNDGGEVF